MRHQSVGYYQLMSVETRLLTDLKSSPRLETSLSDHLSALHWPLLSQSLTVATGRHEPRQCPQCLLSQVPQYHNDFSPSALGRESQNVTLPNTVASSVQLGVQI